MSVYVQLLQKKMVGRKVYDRGDWVRVGTQTAEEWVAEGAARLARDVQRAVAQKLTQTSAPPPPEFTESTRELIEKVQAPAVVSSGLRVAFGMIVFNGDHVLQGVLESVYPWASQICIAEGPVKFHADRLGVATSTDRTMKIIEDFPDPDNKISLVQGVWPEKTDMCNAWIEMVAPETDYVWQIDCDEMYRQKDIERVLSLLGPDGYDSVAFRFRSFYGGFERHMIGWEEAQETHRIQRFYPGAKWHTHRPPTILAPDGQPWRKHKHLSHWELDAATGIRIFHYSFVWPSQAEMKYAYYDNLTKGAVVEDGLEKLYIPWVTGDDRKKAQIEREFKGVHHLRRGPDGQCVCHTAKFYDVHPKWIEENRAELEARIQKELEPWV